jgi:hypothetical protein
MINRLCWRLFRWKEEQLFRTWLSRECCDLVRFYICNKKVVFVFVPSDPQHGFDIQQHKRTARPTRATVEFIRENPELYAHFVAEVSEGLCVRFSWAGS